MGDARVSVRGDDTLATFSLGSCIGVTMYDPVARVGAMLHFQLPTSSINVDGARENPFKFADTGMERLFAQLIAAGADAKRLKVKLAGAAQMLSGSELFGVGRRNHAAVRKILWQRGVFVAGEDIGG